MFTTTSEIASIDWLSQVKQAPTETLELVSRGRIRIKGQPEYLVQMVDAELTSRQAPPAIIRTVKEITDYRLSQLGYKRMPTSWTAEEIASFRTTITSDFFADLALVGWGTPDRNSERRQREVARYHNAAWRELLNNYLALKEQLKQAKQVLSSTPPASAPWSAWTKHVKRMKSVRQSTVSSLTRKVAAARKALGTPIVVWKRRPLNAPRPKVVGTYQLRRAA